jgi:hypothetical protein
MLRYGNFALFYILFLTLNITLGGCALQPAQATQSPKVQQLRITNAGSYAITNLVVRFPDDRISFGDVPVGETTEYKEVPNGVFNYAAYEYEVDGEVRYQTVIDWMGETPMEGSAFTYTINFDPERFATNDSVQLLEVKTDN